MHPRALLVSVCGPIAAGPSELGGTSIHQRRCHRLEWTKMDRGSTVALDEVMGRAGAHLPTPSLLPYKAAHRRVAPAESALDRPRGESNDTLQLGLVVTDNNGVGRTEARLQRGPLLRRERAHEPG